LALPPAALVGGAGTTSGALPALERVVGAMLFSEEVDCERLHHSESESTHKCYVFHEAVLCYILYDLKYRRKRIWQMGWHRGLCSLCLAVQSAFTRHILDVFYMHCHVYTLRVGIEADDDHKKFALFLCYYRQKCAALGGTTPSLRAVTMMSIPVMCANRCSLKACFVCIESSIDSPAVNSVATAGPIGPAAIGPLTVFPIRCAMPSARISLSILKLSGLALCFERMLHARCGTFRSCSQRANNAMLMRMMFG